MAQCQSLTPGKTLDIILFRAVCLHVDTIPQGCNAYPVCFYPIRIEVWANLIPHGYVNRKNPYILGSRVRIWLCSTQTYKPRICIYPICNYKYGPTRHSTASAI